MRNLNVFDVLPAMISQLTSDLAECVECEWALGLGPGLLPLSIQGQHHDLDRCIADISAVLSEEPQARGALSAPEPLHPDNWAPRITCPIRRNGELVAVVALGPKKSGDAYSAGDRDFITGFTEHFSRLMTDNSLTTAVCKDIEQLRHAQAELESAREVQHRFLTFPLPPIKGLDYYGECHPVGEVGSDFFDFTVPDSSSLLLSIGDVSGKGVPAAIVMAGLQASVRALGLGPRNEICALVRDLNRMVCRLSPDNFYATMFYARIDSVRRQMQYVNAGHEPPLLVRKRNQAVVRLESTGTVVGLSTRSGYSQRTIPIEPGDVLVAATDGVMEALYAEGRDVHEQVVFSAVRDHPGASSSDLAAHIFRAATTHGDTSTHCTTPSDDRTVVVVRFVDTGMFAFPGKPAKSHALAHAAVAC
jgi:phosphoserine phosphatase RsbU/P